MTKIRREVLDDAVEHLRRCGRGRTECVVYLTGPLEHRDLVDAAVHPSHAATAVEYEVDSAALSDLWAELLTSRRTVRAQVHTHPGAAYHSQRDDASALISTPGYLSLVLPDFALGPVGLDGAFLAERLQDGSWAAVSPSQRIEILR